jgi:hypothetical protein
MKYTIVGCITQYGVEQIRPFVESIERSGFGGEKVMLVYDVSKCVGIFSDYIEKYKK